MPSMPHWRRSALRCAAIRAPIRARHRMPWREARPWPTTRRYARRWRSWPQASGKLRSYNSARCCARRNCRMPTQRPAARRDWTSHCGAALQTMRILQAGWSWPSVWREASKSHRRLPYSGCARPQRVLAELHGARRLSEWVAVWMDALETGPWAFRSRWSSIEYQAAERFRELLASLSVGDAVFGTHSRDSAQRILARAARETAFQVQTGVPRDLGERPTA